VGIYQRDAEARGIEITTLTVPMTDVDRAVVDGEDEGFVRIHLRKGSDAILGATVVAENAGEMITQLTIAMSNGLGLLSLGKTIRPYPTCGEAIKRVADLYNRTRLSPWLKAICDRWLRWQRNC
jgi:pyruvate/2-oxoglutarate dehydrogenase complex dihydrolipoamide dehydrogenase (E3) component